MGYVRSTVLGFVGLHASRRISPVRLRLHLDTWLVALVLLAFLVAWLRPSIDDLSPDGPSVPDSWSMSMGAVPDAGPPPAIGAFPVAATTPDGTKDVLPSSQPRKFNGCGCRPD